MTALDYASDPKIIKLLISSGATAYPSNYKEICPNNEYNRVNCVGKTSNLIEEMQTKQLQALETLLNFYNQDYGRSEEDAEFIVRLPQIIASGLYEGSIAKILNPLEEYWQEIVSPASIAYIDRHDIGTVCFASIDL